MDIQQRKELIKPHPHVSIASQSKLLDISRSSYYYTPVPESPFNLYLMELMDKHYLEYPDKGPRRMRAWLARVHGLEVNIKRLNRLYYKVMQLKSILPGPHTSKPSPGHKVYPYLLRDLAIIAPNQVWQTDISYIPLPSGYLYLTAWIDVYSRYVLNWSISNTMTAEWCSEVFFETINKYGRPQIVNTDQGSQYTSAIFTAAVLADEQTKLSMDGKGRATDNAHIERLWRSVKYECVYLYGFDNGSTLFKGLDNYFNYYNNERDHSSLGYGLPNNFYFN